MIRDFLDKRAKRRRCDRTWLDVTFVALPATIAAVLAVSDQLTRWLSYFPLMTLVIHAALPILALIATTVIIVAKTARAASAGFQHGGNDIEMEYRFCTAARQTAKLAFFPMLAIASTSLWTAMPNRLRGSTLVTGYVCNEKGTALNGAFVQLLDRYDCPVTATCASDDRGFFVVEIAKWKTRPAALRINALNCTEGVYQLSSASAGRSCPGEPVEGAQMGESLVWVTKCR